MSDEQMTLTELLDRCTDGHRPEREIPVSCILPVLRDLIARAERAEAALARVEAECDRLAELSRGASFALDWEEAERLGAIGKAVDVIRKAMNETEAGDVN